MKNFCVSCSPVKKMAESEGEKFIGPFRYALPVVAAHYGNWEECKAMLQQGYPIVPQYNGYSFGYHSFGLSVELDSTIITLNGFSFSLNSDITKSLFVRMVLNCASKKGNPEDIKWLFGNYVVTAENMKYCISFAMSGNKFENVVELQRQGALLSNEDAYTAANEGNLTWLKFLFDHKCPWDSDTSYYCVFGENLECLRFVYEKGCPIDYRVFERSFCLKNLSFCQYSVQNNFPISIKSLIPIINSCKQNQTFDSDWSDVLFFYFQKIRNFKFNFGLELSTDLGLHSYNVEALKLKIDKFVIFLAESVDKSYNWYNIFNGLDNLPPTIAQSVNSQKVKYHSQISQSLKSYMPSLHEDLKYCIIPYV